MKNQNKLNGFSGLKRTRLLGFLILFGVQESIQSMDRSLAVFWGTTFTGFAIGLGYNRLLEEIRGMRGDFYDREDKFLSMAATGLIVSSVSGLLAETLDPCENIRIHKDNMDVLKLYCIFSCGMVIANISSLLEKQRIHPMLKINRAKEIDKNSLVQKPIDLKEPCLVCLQTFDELKEMGVQQMQCCGKFICSQDLVSFMKNWNSRSHANDEMVGCFNCRRSPILVREYGNQNAPLMKISIK